MFTMTPHISRTIRAAAVLAATAGLVIPSTAAFAVAPADPVTPSPTPPPTAVADVAGAAETADPGDVACTDPIAGDQVDPEALPGLTAEQAQDLGDHHNGMQVQVTPSTWRFYDVGDVITYDVSVHATGLGCFFSPHGKDNNGQTFKKGGRSTDETAWIFSDKGRHVVTQADLDAGKVVETVNIDANSCYFGIKIHSSASAIAVRG